jgi:hypothetical protein
MDVDRKVFGKVTFMGLRGTAIDDELESYVKSGAYLTFGWIADGEGNMVWLMLNSNDLTYDTDKMNFGRARLILIIRKNVQEDIIYYGVQLGLTDAGEATMGNSVHSSFCL